VKTRSLPCFDSRSKRPSWTSSFVQRVMTSLAIDRSVGTVRTGYTEILNRPYCDTTTPGPESRPELVVADKLYSGGNESPSEPCLDLLILNNTELGFAILACLTFRHRASSI